MSSAFTDRERLAKDAYATPKHLQSRISIYSYRQPPLDVIQFAHELIEWRGDEVLLDAGCGPGLYVLGFKARTPGITPVAVDLSPGMLSAARDASVTRVAAADVVSLPFPDGGFDVALAMHMLYHVPHIPAAAAELRRVLKPGGVLLASTNSVTHLRELKALFAEAASVVTGRSFDKAWQSAERFNLESGEDLLSTAFDEVRRKAAWGTLRVPEVAPIVDYIRSMKALRSDVVSDDAEWDAVVAEIERRAAAHIAEHGVFEIAARAGVFVCR